MAESQERSDGSIVCENCGESFDPRGFPAHEASCEGGNGDDDGSEGAGNNTGAIPTEQEFYENHDAFLGTLMGTEEAWDGKSMATTVAVQAIRKHSESASEKGELYREVFGACPVDGCQRGQNGFEKDYCGNHEDHGSDPSEDDSTDDEESKAELILHLVKNQGMSYDDAKAEVESLS